MSLDRKNSTSEPMMDNVSGGDITNEDESCRSPMEWTLLAIAVIIGIAIILFILRKIIQGPFYRKKNRIDGKVVIITGCNTGIGRETALELARRGGKIYMACRDPVRCEGARLEIIEKSKNENIYNRTLDLASLESVRKFVEKFLAEETRLDVLINNAGIMATPKGFTKDGFEQQFGVNHLGHFLLTNLLFDTLKASAPSRIINVTSAMYLFGKINKNDLMSEKSYSKFGAYSQSKLANILFTKKLAEKLHGTSVTANCCHPGVVKTELSRYLIGKKMKSLLDPITRFAFKSPLAGAQTTLRLALDPALEKSTGGYYFDTIRCPILPKAKNKEMADWLWQISEEFVGLSHQQQTLLVVAAPETNGDPVMVNGNGIKIEQPILDNNTTVIDVEQTPDIVEITEETKKKMIMGTLGDETEKTDEPEKISQTNTEIEIKAEKIIDMIMEKAQIKVENAEREAVKENGISELPEEKQDSPEKSVKLDEKSM